VGETLATFEDSRKPPTTSGPSFILKAGSRFRHFPELDGLRGSAVLFVVIGHTLVFKLGRGNSWTQFAALGVLIFFVLSGFLITGLLCSEERRFGKISLRNFYLRRAFRILPAFSVFILIVMLLIQLQLINDVSRRSVAVAVLFVRNIYDSGPTLAHLWSLALEEQFYLVWPIFFRLVGRRGLLAPTLGIILGVAVYRGVAIHIAPYEYGRGIFELRPDFRMDSILVGCALALALDRRTGQSKAFPPLVRWGTHPVWVLPLLLYWTFYCDVEPARSVYLSLQTALVCCLVFHVIAFQNSVVGYLLRRRWICFVGLISYSLYLWQQPFLVVSTPSWGFIRQIPFCLFIAVAIAVLSYFLVERPFLRLKRRFSSAQ
jgi:peptidoglycan/LPS O-acetylase OafA/YrhL